MFQQEQYMQPPVLERSAPLTNDTGDDDDDYDPPMLQENVSHIDNANFKLIKNMPNEHCNCHPHHDHDHWIFVRSSVMLAEWKTKYYYYFWKQLFPKYTYSTYFKQLKM